VFSKQFWTTALVILPLDATYCVKLSPSFNRLHHEYVRRVEDNVCPFDFEGEMWSFRMLTFESPGIMYVRVASWLSRVCVCVCVCVCCNYPSREHRIYEDN